MKSITLIFLTLMLGFTLFAQEDAESCKDHPMFNRMPNTYIIECSKNFNEMEIQTASQTFVSKEGMKTFINYAYDTEKPGTPPSFFQIVKNYENAVIKLGGKKVFFLNGTSSTLYVKTATKEIWIVLEDYTPTNGDGNFSINILEIEAMQQEILASDILNELTNNGHIALYINFETGKSEIKQESRFKPNAITQPSQCSYGSIGFKGDRQNTTNCKRVGPNQTYCR